MYAVHRLPEKIDYLRIKSTAGTSQNEKTHPLIKGCMLAFNLACVLFGNNRKRVGENKYGLRKPQTTTLDHRQPHQKELETL